MHNPPDNLTAWRASQRRRLIDERMRIDLETLTNWQYRMDRHLAHGFNGLFDKRATELLAICWPVRNEYDARPLASRLRETGTRIALPVVVKSGQPLLFREWDGQEDKLARDNFGTSHPVSGPAVTPTAMLLPMVGFDRHGYRLGYGGGYFDRTLAAMPKRPLVIGIAHELARMDTLYPQPHDIPMDYVVTEMGLFRRENGELVSDNS